MSRTSNAPAADETAGRVEPEPPTESAATFEVRGRVGIITLNRPAARNAANRAMGLAVAAALDELDARDDLSVGVLTGAGGTFCAGMDLRAYVTGELPMVDGRGFLGLVQATPSTPLIAAVEGHALAGGFEAVLACDLVVAAQDATFGLPEVRRGLVAGAGGLMNLPEKIHPNLAMEFLLTGAPITAARATEVGLVNRLASPGRALEVALELAETIAANGPMAVRVAKQVVTESRSWPRDERFDRQRELIVPVFESADAKEGARAFAERRDPVWVGH